MATGEPSIGTRIRRARERQRWTQQQLASELRVNIKTIDNWENGRTHPRNSIGAIEDVLGIDLTRAGERAATVPPRLRKMVAALTPEEQSWLIRELTGEPGDGSLGDDEAAR